MYKLIFKSQFEKDTESFGVLERAVELDEKTGSGIAEDIKSVLFTTYLFAFLFPDDLLFFADFNCKHKYNLSSVK